MSSSMFVPSSRMVSPSRMSEGPYCVLRCATESAPSCLHWQAQVVEHLDLLWEDHGDMDFSPLEPFVDQQRQRPEEERETGLGETTSERLPSTVDGLPVTTLILRSLPAGVTQTDLLQSLPGPGAARYNLLHVPQKVKGAPSPGFAFLNFETHDDAYAFFRQWHGRQVQIPIGGTVVSSSVIKIEAAKHQGFVASLCRWQTSMRGLSNPAMLPAVFSSGRRQDFWLSVRCVQACTMRGRSNAIVSHTPGLVSCLLDFVVAVEEQVRRDVRV